MQALVEFPPPSLHPDVRTATTLSAEAHGDLLAPQTVVPDVPTTNVASFALPTPDQVRHLHILAHHSPCCMLCATQTLSIDPQLLTTSTGSASADAPNLSDLDNDSDGDQDLRPTPGTPIPKRKPPTLLDPYCGLVEGAGRGNGTLGPSLPSALCLCCSKRVRDPSAT
jgi:hypothetical protein